ncbi:hypothetical protein ABTE58_18910 [Acinetobacter baumannii]
MSNTHGTAAQAIAAAAATENSCCQLQSGNYHSLTVANVHNPLNECTR